MNIGGYSTEPCSPGQASETQKPTTKDQIKDKIAQAEKDVAKLKRLQEIFEKTPDLQETLDLLRGVHIY